MQPLKVDCKTSQRHFQPCKSIHAWKLYCRSFVECGTGGDDDDDDDDDDGDDDDDDDDDDGDDDDAT